MSDFEKAVKNAQAMGYDCKTDDFDLVKCDSGIMTFGMDDYPKFNVLVLNKGGQGKYYEGWDFTKSYNTGIPLANAVAIITTQKNHNISNLNEFRIQIEISQHMWKAMDFKVYGVESDENLALLYSQPGSSTPDWSGYDFFFKPVFSRKGPIVTVLDNPSYGGTVNNFILECRDWVISWENSDEKLTNKISGFFSDLGDKISNWFNNLKEWIKAIPDKISEMIDSVGGWFEDIKNSIGNWFEDIKISIEVKIQEVKDWFTNLFTIPSSFADEYKAKWQGFLKARFGFLYESVNMVVDVFQRINDGLVEKRHVITFPKIKIPWIDQPLMQSQEFCFEDFVNKYVWSKNLYSIYTVGVWGLFVFMFINLAYRKYNNIVGVSNE